MTAPQNDFGLPKLRSKFVRQLSFLAVAGFSDLPAKLFPATGPLVRGLLHQNR